MIFGDLVSRLSMACYGGLEGILAGLTKSTDHPSKDGKTQNDSNKEKNETPIRTRMIMGLVKIPIMKKKRDDNEKSNHENNNDNNNTNNGNESTRAS